MFTAPQAGAISLLYLLFILSSVAHADVEDPEDTSAASAPYIYTIEHDPWPAFLDLIEEQLHDHPILRARREEANALRASIAGVGLRPDPTLSLSAMYLPWKPPSLTADSMSGVELGLSVPIWYPKELRAQKSSIEAQASALESAEDTARTDLLMEAAALYYEVYAIDRAISALEDVQPMFQEHIELLKKRIPTGHATLVQVERARLSALRLEDQIHTQKDARPAKVARLNALLDLPAEHRLPSLAQANGVSAQRTEIRITPKAPHQELDRWVTRGVQHRPTFDALERQKESARAEARVAAWAKKPQLEVFGSWMFRAAPPPGPLDRGMDMFSVGIQSTLPFSGKNRARAAEEVAEARGIALNAEAAAFERALRTEIAARLGELHRIAEHAHFYKEELLPQAYRVRDAALRGLDAQRADYESWLDAQQQIAEFHVAYAQLEAQTLAHHAMLYMLSGDLHRHNASETAADGEPTP